LRAPIVRQLLGVLERLPDHATVIFTTTRDGQGKLFDDNIDADPLLSRCVEIPLTNQGLAQAFATRAHEIATELQLTDQAPAEFVKLARRCGNNMRRMLQEIGKGKMLSAVA
jgi:hypothetical protein